jgi:radical SAM protein with 4Fe4S-binding SPASM domain
MCPHSNDSWRAAWKPRTMTLDEFKSIIKKMPGIRHVELNGAGEPLLNPYLFDMMSHAHEKALTTAFFTNATLMTPEISKRLVETLGLVEIRVSIDTADPQAYAASRVGADFAEVLENLKCLVGMRKSTGRAFPAVTVSMTAMPEFVEDIPKLVDTLKKIGLNALQVKDVIAIDGILDNKQLAPEHAALIGRCQKTFVKEGFVISHLRSTTINRIETRTCVAPWNTMYVNAHGGVHPCCFTPFQEMVFGNIFEKGFKEIWNNKAYRDFRRELKTGMPRFCAHCPAHGQKMVFPDEGI